MKIVTPFLELVFCAGKLSDARENYPTYCMYRRGRIVTRGVRDSSHWIVLPTKYQVGTEQSKRDY